MKDIFYRKIFRTLNEDLNMILSDDDFEEPEIDLGVHMSNIQTKVLSDGIFNKCKEQDVQGLKELINNNWDGQTPIFFASNDNIKDVVNFSIKALGNKANLNWMDTSKVTDMSELFSGDYIHVIFNPFNGDISGWDVSNVTNMSNMFLMSAFNGDISNWDVSSVTTMFGMFWCSKFNGDISRWDVSNVTTMNSMFANSAFNGDISKWDVSNVTNMYCMFRDSGFNQDISGWDVLSVIDITWMFKRCPLARKQNYWPNFNYEQ